MDEKGRYVDAAGTEWYLCRNLTLSGCTWLARRGWPVLELRPDPDPSERRRLRGLANFPSAERAKRHLVAELDTLGFPVVGKHEDPENGLAFDLLSSVEENVVIGHANGRDHHRPGGEPAAHRERVREKLGEPYRTMLGHFRHEVGHYYEWQLVRGDELLAPVPRAVR